MVENGWPNAESIQNASIPITITGKAYQLPDMVIPDGMAVLIKSQPTNGGFIFVAPSAPEAIDRTRSYPLQPGEFIEYKVKNAKAIWVSGTVVNDLVLITAERN